ncbi:hypothetical protein PTI98_012732 [Pleurotus ostreatus]|nr:hypothetical protein PTI98_012732 [Pleurotus ostreatus]
MSPLTPTSAEILDDHLSYPTLQLASSTLEVKQVPPQPRQILQDRLYIGNLHPSVDEYSLLQVFSKFGKVTKMDFLFHKTGALKGKPRGYAFVEYADKSVRSFPIPIFSRLVAHPGSLSHCTQRIEQHTTVPYRLTAKSYPGRGYLDHDE